MGRYSKWSGGESSQPSPPDLQLAQAAGRANLNVIEGAWVVGCNAPSPSPESCRSHLINALERERDSAQTAPNRMFAGALLESLDFPDLQLPNFPETAQQLDRQLATLEPNYSQVMRTVEADPNLVGRVWQIARSPRFPSAPSSLDMAVSRVGMVEIWRISVQMAMESIRIQTGPFKDRGDSVRLHGVLVGDVTAALAKERRGPQFLSGLLHDVGELLILEAASRTNPDPLMVDRIAARHHAAIGVLVAHAWRLDPNVAPAIAFHHNPAAAPMANQELARLVCIADIAVSGALDHRRGCESHPELAIQMAAVKKMDASRPLVLADRSIDRMERDGMKVVEKSS